MSKKYLEQKLREDQEATAFAFQEFIKTFQDVPITPNKTFVKSGILNAETGQEIETEKGQIYNPQPFIKQNSNTIIQNAIECARLLKENKINRLKGQEKPKTNLELLKEELKLRHAERETKCKLKDELIVHSSWGVLSSTDPTTTNLFIAQINPNINEQNLMQLFGIYGPLASVKILWPRIDEKNRSANCGFVAFMSRKDAERALLAINNYEGMRIGWGKPVDLPQTPIYVPPELLKLSLPPPYTGLPFNAQPFKQSFENPTTEEEMNNLLYNSIVKVTIPLDKKILMVLHRTIEFVIREGPLFEAIIMNREISNPLYQFLFDNKKPEHIYYRWKLYSLMHGDTQKQWSTKEFRLFQNGSIWSPPINPNYSKGMPESLVTLSARVNKNMLSDTQKSRFVQLIQTLNVTTKKIGEAMVFCLNHVDAVKDIVDIIIDSFMNKETKAPKKVARLYLVSDVLYNSSMKKCYAPIYKTEFESQLVDIFQHLRETYLSLLKFVDKITFKTKVLNVLRSWDLWKIFSSDYLYNLESTFLGINSENEGEYESDCDEPLDGANLIKRSIINGANCLVKEEKQKKCSKSIKITSKQDQLPSAFVPSKWEIVDPQEVEAQAMSTKKFHDLEIERKLQEEKKKNLEPSPNKKLFDENRELLRKIEIMVMHYRDDIETGKRKLPKENNLENELNNFRQHLMEKTKKENELKIKTEKSLNSENSDSWSDNGTKQSCSKSKRQKRSYSRDRETQKHRDSKRNRKDQKRHK